MAMDTTTGFDAVESIRQRMAALSSSHDAGPTLQRRTPVNFNQISHLQTDIEQNWQRLLDGDYVAIRELFNVRELHTGDVIVELK